MRGIGGPLLCIGDLLSDVGEPDDNGGDHQPLRRCDRTPLSPSDSPSSIFSSSSPRPNFDSTDLNPSDLNKIFEENYDQLNKALAGTDHSWTSLTLKLCSTLDTANKMIKSTNSNAVALSEKVAELERVMKRGDLAVADARSIHSSLIQKRAL